MTRLKTGTATIALALALAASPALANQEMRENADQIMNDYGFDVDASLLSDEQLIQFMVLDDLEDKPRAAVSNRISGILDDNPATETYASGVTVEWMTGERDQLVAHADQVMNDYGVEADPSDLTEEQLVELFFHDFSDGSRAENVNAIQGIITGS
jgi:hypothetical protein